MTAEVLVRLVNRNQPIYIPQGAMHRMENPGQIPLTLIQGQTGSNPGDDDMVRYKDAYARP